MSVPEIKHGESWKKFQYDLYVLVRLETQENKQNNKQKAFISFHNCILFMKK